MARCAPIRQEQLINGFSTNSKIYYDPNLYVATKLWQNF